MGIYWHGPPPLDMFDSSMTGTRMEYDDLVQDSVQAFWQYAETRKNGNGWVIAGNWLRKNLLQKEFDKPKEILLDIFPLASVNLAYANIIIGILDTTTQYWNDHIGEVFETSSAWQTYKVNTFESNVHHIHEVQIIIQAFASDSMYVGLTILLYNLRFVYANGDTILVDPFNRGTPLAVKPLPGIPTGFALHQNYPNPFNPTTVIRYEVKGTSKVTLDVYNLIGEHIATLVDAEQMQGIYEADFDGTGLPSGTYVYALSVNGRRVDAKKMMMVK